MQRRRRLATAWSLMGTGALALVGSGALALPGLIHAAPSYVVTNCTTSNTNGTGKTPASGDLEWAVDQADTTPGTITFSCAPGSTISVVGTLNVTNTMTINGLSTDKKSGVILDGGGSVQLFIANASGMVFTLENLTLRSGSGPAAGASGGGAVLLNAGTLDATNDTFYHNTIQNTTSAAPAGGAISSFGTLNITNCAFTDNSATDSSTTTAGAGGGAVVNAGPGALMITGSTFKGNTATSTGTGVGGGAISEGGAIINSGTGNLTIASSIFEDNAATATTVAGNHLVSLALGGAVYEANSGALSIQSGTLFEHNSASATGDTALALGGAVQGGFLFAPAAGAVTLDHSSLIGNTASATITGANGNVPFAPLLPNSGGGGLYVTQFQQAATVTNSTISGNSATVTLAKGATATNALAFGGGLATETLPGSPVPPVTIDDSTISGNTVSNPLTNQFSSVKGAPGAYGGGVLSFGSDMAITRSTIADNAASGVKSVGAGEGGGIADVNALTGGVFSAGSITVGASIVAKNTATSGPDCAIQGTETDLGYNLESGTDCFGKTPATGDKQNVSNPGLASTLGNNGGPTETLALLAGSPAIDAIPDPTSVTLKGSTTVYNLCPGAPASDQRGTARPQGKGCDIGAYEYHPSAPSTGLSGNGAPHNPITAQTTTHQGTQSQLPTLPSPSKLPKLPKLTPQQPVIGSAVAHAPRQSGFPLALAALLAILGFALLGSGALVLGRTRKVDGQ